MKKLLKILSSHPTSRFAGALLLAVPLYLTPARPDLARVFATIIVGFVGWLLGPIFFVQSTVRRAVRVGALVSATLAFASLILLGSLSALTPADPIGFFSPEPGHSHFVGFAILAIYIAYVGGVVGCISGWVVVLVRHLQFRRQEGSMERR